MDGQHALRQPLPSNVTPLPDSSASFTKAFDEDQLSTSSFALNKEPLPLSAHGESAIPADKREEAPENIEDDWENDPINARNWPTKKKWTMVAIISYYAFIPPLANSMVALALPEIGVKYDTENETIIAMTLDIFFVSFAIGLLLLSPLSEMYGRTWVLHIGNIFFLFFNLGCAFSPTVGSIIAFRFLLGFSGSASICGIGSICDLFSEHDRLSALRLYFLPGFVFAPMLLGPIVGGFLTQSVGVKWVFIVPTAACGVGTIVGIPLLEETCAPILQMKRDRHCDPEKQSPSHSPLRMEISKVQHLWMNLIHPRTLLAWRGLTCFFLSLYMALLAWFSPIFYRIGSAILSSFI